MVSTRNDDVNTLGGHHPQASSLSESGYVRFHLGGCREDDGRVGKVICPRVLLIAQQSCPLLLCALYLFQGRVNRRPEPSDQNR